MVAKIARTTGELLMTAGFVLLFFVAYELWGTGVHTARAQNVATERLETLWANSDPLTDPLAEEAFEEPLVDDPVVVAPEGSAAPASTAPGSSPAARPTARPRPAPPRDIPIGTGLARLRVPRWGADYQWIVGEGVTRNNLKDGPGHYPKTALPGQVGNFVVSGHRTTYGAPFAAVEELRAGDAMVVETAKTWHTYRVRDSEIVHPTKISVTLPVPKRPGATPTERLMTLTTCHPKFSAAQRYIVYLVLESSLPKAGGARPPALQGA